MTGSPLWTEKEQYSALHGPVFTVTCGSCDWKTNGPLATARTLAWEHWLAHKPEDLA